MKSLFIRFARLLVLIALSVYLTGHALAILQYAPLEEGNRVALFLVITVVPMTLILLMLRYPKQPAKLTQEPAVIRIESFPKSNGPQIAGVITRYTGIYGVDDLLKKLPVEFDVEAETSEDLKCQLQQLGCN